MPLNKNILRNLELFAPPIKRKAVAATNQEDLECIKLFAGCGLDRFRLQNFISKTKSRYQYF